MRNARRQARRHEDDGARQALGLTSGLTPLQARCLDAIRRLTVDGVPPTVAEIQADLGTVSRGTTHNILVRLRERGMVTWLPRQSRSIQIVDATPDLEAMSSGQLDRLIERAQAILAARAESSR